MRQSHRQLKPVCPLSESCILSLKVTEILGLTITLAELINRGYGGNLDQYLISRILIL